MCQNNEIELRKFSEEDIPNKIKWINDSANNTYLHYDLPLEFDKTLRWFQNNKDKENRYDAVILYDGVPVGLIGLLGIDRVNRKAEYYICLGEHNIKGKGIATRASKLLFDYAFETLDLNKIYLYTEVDNLSAQKLFERRNFKKEWLFVDDLIYNGRKVSRYAYALLKEDASNEW